MGQMIYKCDEVKWKTLHTLEGSGLCSTNIEKPPKWYFAPRNIKTQDLQTHCWLATKLTKKISSIPLDSHFQVSATLFHPLQAQSVGRTPSIQITLKSIKNKSSLFILWEQRENEPLGTVITKILYPVHYFSVQGAEQIKQTS